MSSEEIKQIKDTLKYYETTKTEPTYCEELITTGELERTVEEIERLNNIINELDKFLKDKIDSWKKANDDLIVKDTIYHERLTVRLIYDYLQELKGSDK